MVNLHTPVDCIQIKAEQKKIKTNSNSLTGMKGKKIMHTQSIQAMFIQIRQS